MATLVTHPAPRLGGVLVAERAELAGRTHHHRAERLDAEPFESLMGGVQSRGPAQVAHHGQKDAVDVLAEQAARRRPAGSGSSRG